MNDELVSRYRRTDLWKAAVPRNKTKAIEVPYGLAAFRPGRFFSKGVKQTI